MFSVSRSRRTGKNSFFLVVAYKFFIIQVHLISTGKYRPYIDPLRI